MTEPSPRPPWPVVLWHAIRPHTLPLSISPVLAGATVAWAESGASRPAVVLVAALSALAIQVGTNLHNDAADTLNETDDADREGPPRVTERGWMTAGQVMLAAHAAFGLAVLGGLWLVLLGGWPIMAIGVLSVLAGYAYSAGPWPISRGPLGEVFVILFFGLIAVGGVVYLLTGAVSGAAALMGLVVGLPAAAVLMVNNARDRVGDTRAGRRTLAIRLGPRGADRVYVALLAATLAGLVSLAAVDPALRGALLGLVFAPMAVSLARAFAAADGPAAFNAVLGRTARFQLLLVAAGCAGVIVWTAVI
ncbi:1,4-dihydroxy-2-naphthoate octaprenyltransferase [Roseospira visakhapatnamensis]|uniref:1,4-dihydroxy-2-naphthoate octaprenyltransferase n=1 Tax=Roseospira visakhapatnamensis TaxID=390880 RepID=A0A7W6WAF7_9PROT|nr:1,4-dihydroxy-2-naphthoate octaprenyltransferase [Roseospira visakhapatnamensis]MBB4266447.1 1,4-dihydroxy-2-naphthoate octaprenyltransferase [Roseospira visakhapatnamensis]